VQLVAKQPDGQDRHAETSGPDADSQAGKRVSFRPLLALRPYLLRHKGMLAAALVALLISAGATLAVPLAVRRMIDLGFSGIEPDLIDKYFATLAGIGLILALASAARFYAVNWLGERVVAEIVGAGGRRYEVVELHQIGLRMRDTAEIDQQAAMLRRLLAQEHPKPDYEIVVPYELLNQSEHTKRVFSWVLGSIAGISLLVGGIGIMNIMLATVTERTREIGIRRALGAKRWHVQLQFLVETIVLSLSGGVLGLGLGLAIPALVEQVAGMKTIVTGQSLALALGISVLGALRRCYTPRLRGRPTRTRSSGGTRRRRGTAEGVSVPNFCEESGVRRARARLCHRTQCAPSVAPPPVTGRRR